MEAINIRSHKRIYSKAKFTFSDSSLIPRSIPNLSRFISNLFSNSDAQMRLNLLSKLILSLRNITIPIFKVRDCTIRSLKMMHNNKNNTIEIYRKDW